MIVLDATIVNVALPVDPGRPRLLAVEPRLGRQRLPDRLRRPAAARRPARRPRRPPRRLPGRPGRLHRSPRCSAAWPHSQEMLIGARFVQGIGGALTSAVILGMIVTMFPEPREQAKAIGVYSFVASAGGSIGLLAGGVLTDGDQLALDLLRQPPDRRSPPALLALRAGRARARASGFGEGADVARRGARSPAALMLGVYTIVERRRLRLGLAADARPRRRLARAAGRRSSAREATAPQPADAAADLPLAQRLRREHRPGPDGRRHVRDVLPRRAVPAAGARLRRARDRPRVPARDAWSSACCRSASRRG